MLRRYLLYLLRWQASTLILAPCVMMLTTIGTIWATVVANLIGGLIFFWVDRYIFYSKGTPLWEVKEHVHCSGCHKDDVRGYRLVKAPNYDRTTAPRKYLCEPCSIRKAENMRLAGIEI